ncbi:3-phosphoglycerate dehydrogenase [Sinirhodobacter populi]|uniref:3-phosphoglycerate dehydrogenase n=1 Tax=Paenirhodobacter populi TaxID=2306993 RepID=A0A443K6B3_9RHOB|nr:NAD(P)-dependent oxidoreductase [Sinirhodobacter populi]RWR28317.1 3-phosphoglycerate dehydrogenase [Sinirhodobacter populi]
MTKCLIVQAMHEDALDLLRQGGIEPVICPDPAPGTVLSLIGDCTAVITRDAGLSGAAMRAAPGLRVVVAHGAGHDAIDKETATGQGILVCNTPGANARSVMELAFGLAIAAARLIPAGDRDERAARAGFRERHRTVELSGKVALIVGWGTIGAGFGRMLRDALGMEVIVHSPRARDLQGFAPVPDLASGLARADLISLHTPLRPETRGLMGRAAFAACKPGAILVNTARAGLVDEEALAEALAEGRIAAAGLDVYSATAPQGPLSRFDQVIFTPHLGGSTEEALIRVGTGSVRNVLTALSGVRPATTVNDPAGWGA